MKKQKSTKADPGTKKSSQQRVRDRLFQTIREIRQDNKDADPDEVFRDVTEAVEAVRQEEYERQTTRRP